MLNSVQEDLLEVWNKCRYKIDLLISHLLNGCVQDECKSELFKLCKEKGIRNIFASYENKKLKTHSSPKHP